MTYRHYISNYIFHVFVVVLDISFDIILICLDCLVCQAELQCGLCVRYWCKTLYSIPAVPIIYLGMGHSFDDEVPRFVRLKPEVASHATCPCFA